MKTKHVIERLVYFVKNAPYFLENVFRIYVHLFATVFTFDLILWQSIS